MSLLQNQIFDCLFNLIILYCVRFPNFVQNNAENSQFSVSGHVPKMGRKNPVKILQYVRIIIMAIVIYCY